MRIAKMSRELGVFRHPSAAELRRLMEKARDERSAFLAKLLGLRTSPRQGGPATAALSAPLSTAAA
jgi:hypothetical protein